MREKVRERGERKRRKNIRHTNLTLAVRRGWRKEARAGKK
jgi:hypothetical protein